MPKSFNRSLAGIVCLCVFCTLVGLAGGWLFSQWKCFKFVPSISLGQTVQSCVLLLVFLLANQFYAKAHDIRKKRIEILVDIVGGIIAQAEQAHANFGKCAGQGALSSAMRLTLDSSLRDYSNSVEELEQVLKRSGYSFEPDALEELKKNRSEYKDLVTETPYPKRMPEHLIPRESKLHMKIRSNLRDFQMNLSMLAS